MLPGTVERVHKRAGFPARRARELSAYARFSTEIAKPAPKIHASWYQDFGFASLSELTSRMQVYEAIWKEILHQVRRLCAYAYRHTDVCTERRV